MNTNASEHYWDGVITHIPQEDAVNSQAEQRNEPLVFDSGAFSGAMSRWSIFENEAFTMVSFMAQTDDYTACSETIIYTDFSNLVFIFGPLKSHPNMPAYFVSTTHRWALISSSTSNILCHTETLLQKCVDSTCRSRTQNRRRLTHTRSQKIQEVRTSWTESYATGGSNHAQGR